MADGRSVGGGPTSAQTGVTSNGIVANDVLVVTGWTVAAAGVRLRPSDLEVIGRDGAGGAPAAREGPAGPRSSPTVPKRYACITNCRRSMILIQKATVRGSVRPPRDRPGI